MLTKSTLTEVEVAKSILAASIAARNDNVSKLIHAFKRVLGFLSDKSKDCEILGNYLRAIGTLVDLAYRAVTENGDNVQIKSYQENLRVYIYYCSIFEQKQYPKLSIKFYDISSNMAQSLVNMLILARESFAKLDYPSYYQEFVNAAKILFAKSC